MDYRRLREQFGNPRLLFVAHRRELLGQSLAAFRQVLRDGAFGELYVDGHRPDEWRHVFASVQSLAQLDLANLQPDAFDVVIVDEFHHAAASTYRRLLDHLKPKVLLGLTATPERADGQSILEWFEGRIAIELRLWEALERGLLCPFHYFGLHGRNGSIQRHMVPARLQHHRTGEHLHSQPCARATGGASGPGQDLRIPAGCARSAFASALPMPSSWRASSLVWAYRAQPSRPKAPATSETAALRRLRARELNILFAVDLFNEGVDVPEIDTVLFLRPTESATVFLQQLGADCVSGKENRA